MSSNTITLVLVLTVTRESDDSFALGLEEHLGDSDERYVGGISEGVIFDPAAAAEDAAWLVKNYLGEQIDRIAVPMDFKKSDS